MLQLFRRKLISTKHWLPKPRQPTHRPLETATFFDAIFEEITHTQNKIWQEYSRAYSIPNNPYWREAINMPHMYDWYFFVAHDAVQLGRGHWWTAHDCPHMSYGPHIWHLTRVPAWYKPHGNRKSSDMLNAWGLPRIYRTPLPLKQLKKSYFCRSLVWLFSMRTATTSAKSKKRWHTLVGEIKIQLTNCTYNIE